MSRDLDEFHQGAHAAPGRVLAGAHPQPLGQPQVDGEQRTERYADEGRIETYTVLLWLSLAARRARGGAGPPTAGGTLRSTETSGGRIGALPLQEVRRRGPVQWLRQRHEVVAAVGAAEYRTSATAPGVFSFRRRHCMRRSTDGGQLGKMELYRSGKFPVGLWVVTPLAHVYLSRFISRPVDEH